MSFPQLHLLDELGPSASHWTCKAGRHRKKSTCLQRYQVFKRPGSWRVRQKLFWAGTDDNKHGIIEAVSLDGLNRSVIFYEQGYHPFCLDTFEGYVYWADWGRNAILRINSLGGEAEVIIEYLNKPMGLKILHPREPRPGTYSDSPYSRKTLIIAWVSLRFRQLQKSSLIKFPRKELVTVFRRVMQQFWASQNLHFFWLHNASSRWPGAFEYQVYFFVFPLT